jgi:MFS family permease
MKDYFRNMSFRLSTPRDLGLVAGGRAISFLGDEVAVIALLLWASDAGHGASAVAALVMAAALPQLLLAPLAGLVVDRFPARRLIAGVTLAQAVVCLVLVPAVASGRVLVVVALVAVLNVGQAIAGPAWQALVPALVPAERLSSALATVQTAVATAALLGPALGGLLVGTAGTSWALVVDAVTFVLVAGAALLVRGDRRPEGSTGREKGAALAGIRVVLRDPVLRAVFVLLGATLLALGAVNVAEVFLVTQTLGASATVYGLLGALYALGLMAGARLTRRERSDARAGRLLVLGLLGMALAIVALGLAPGIAVAAVASFCVGVGNGALNVLTQTLLVRRTPRPVLGRVFAALQGVVGAAMLAATALAGVLLGVLDVRQVIVASGAFAALVVVVVGRRLLRAAPPAAAVGPPEQADEPTGQLGGPPSRTADRSTELVTTVRGGQPS